MLRTHPDYSDPIRNLVFETLGKPRPADGISQTRIDAYRERLGGSDVRQLAAYADQTLALTQASDRLFRWRVFQDIVNALGGKLEFDVGHGLYKGVKAAPAEDGLWVDASAKWAFLVDATTQKPGSPFKDPKVIEDLVAKNTSEQSYIGVVFVAPSWRHIERMTSDPPGRARVRHHITLEGLVRAAFAVETKKATSAQIRKRFRSKEGLERELQGYPRPKGAPKFDG